MFKKVFPTLTDEEISRLEADARQKNYPAGICLCEEGEIGSTFYVLVEGRVRISVRISQGEDLTIKELEPGSYFGEMALVADQPRSASVRTLTDCQVLEIEKPALRAVLDNNPGLVIAMMRRVSRNLWDNDRRTIQAMQRKNEALALAYQRLETQQKLRTEFITTLSHELRTPLTAAQGFLHLINSGAVPQEQRPSALATVTRNVEQVVAITNSLITLHEMDLLSPHIESVFLPSLAQDVIKEVTSHRDRPASSVCNQVPEDLPPIQADQDGIFLALRALVDNAVKFSQDESPATLTAHVEGKDVFIRVTDQGIGMSEETVARLFEPYFRAKGLTGDQLFDGLGIGLALAKFVVERHGGAISVTSHLGEGSTFTVRLPISPTMPE